MATNSSFETRERLFAMTYYAVYFIGNHLKRICVRSTVKPYTCIGGIRPLDPCNHAAVCVMAAIEAWLRPSPIIDGAGAFNITPY